MSEPSYEVVWVTEDILVIRRRGQLSIDQVNDCFADVRRALERAPVVWGLVVDAGDAVPQTEAVSGVLQRMMTHTAIAAHRVAVNTGRVVNTMQIKRLNAAAGVGLDAVSYHQSFDAAYVQVEQDLSAARS